MRWYLLVLVLLAGCSTPEVSDYRAARAYYEEVTPVLSAYVESDREVPETSEDPNVQSKEEWRRTFRAAAWWLDQRKKALLASGVSEEELR